MDPALRALPEGQIDPWLKTISFWNGEEPLAALSVYACHPVSYRDEHSYTWNRPGVESLTKGALTRLLIR